MATKKRHVFGNLLVIGFLVLVFGGGIYSLWSRDSRFGWGMFSRDTEFLIAYAWVLEDGTRVSYRPGLELRGKAAQLRPRYTVRVAAKSTRHTRYGIGTLRHWISSYLEFAFENYRPDSAVAIEARLYYTVNEPLIINEQIALARQFTFADPRQDLTDGRNSARREILTFPHRDADSRVRVKPEELETLAP